MSSKDNSKSLMQRLNNSSVENLIHSIVQREKSEHNLSTEDALDLLATKLELLDMHERKKFNLGFFKDMPDGSTIFARPDFRIIDDEKEDE